MSHDDRLTALAAENESLRARVAELEAQRSDEAAAFLRSILDAVPAFVIRTDADMNIRYINRLQPGLTMEQVLGSSGYDYVDRRFHQLQREHIERALRTGQVQRFEVIGMGPHDEPAVYETSITPVPEPDGRKGFCIVALEITEHRRQQEALRDNQEKLRLALDAVGIGLWSWDLRTGEVHWDERMKELCGTHKGSDLETYVNELVHPDDREMVAAAGRHTFATGEFISRPHRIVRPDGETRWMITTGKVIKDEAGEPIRLIGGNVDVTEQRAVEEQLRHVQKMEAVGSLTAGIAHNFNNMLMVILPSLELIHSSVPKEQRQLVRDAADAAHRAADMVRQLMTFAGQRRTGSRYVADVGEVTRSALRMCRRVFERHIELAEHVPDDLPPASIDPGGLEQVLLNVLLNARDAVIESGKRSPHIRLSVTTEHVDKPPTHVHDASHDYLCVTIEDDGAGMSDEVRRKIFEPFFTTKDVSRGTGLGLATSYAIVREHNGWIDCASKPGQGARFAIYLPVRSGGASVPARAPRRGEGRQILVVDDEEPIRRVVTAILTEEGYRVSAAATAPAAFARASALPHVDLVLLDRSMPASPGQRLVVALRRALPHTPIVYFTGQPVAEEERNEVDGVITKPLSKDELLATVGEVLRPAPANPAMEG